MSLNQTSFLRVNCSNFYEVSKILLSKKEDIFKFNKYEINPEKILNNFEEKKFYL